MKYLFRADDGRSFETVRIPLERPRWSVCVSSQAGCALACAFCETGRLGFERNLEPWEIVEQVLTVRRESPERPVTGVVFQGQGEPFQNYDNVIRAAEVLRDPCGARIGGDRITISTVGLLPQIERYTEERHPYRLILSLTSAFGEKRARLVPVGARYDVPELAAAMRRHAAARGGPVNLAWVLMSGVNTGPEEARELARLFAGVAVRLSVIDVNDPEGGSCRRADTRSAAASSRRSPRTASGSSAATREAPTSTRPAGCWRRRRGAVPCTRPSRHRRERAHPAATDLVALADAAAVLQRGGLVVRPRPSTASGPTPSTRAPSRASSR